MSTVVHAVFLSLSRTVSHDHAQGGGGPVEWKHFNTALDIALHGGVAREAWP